MADAVGMALLSRMRAVLGKVELDCDCRDRLNDALRRFEVLEQRRGLRDLIADARAQCNRVVGLLDLLKELDEIDVEASDRGVSEELALLFETIATAGLRGAEDMRRFRDLLPGDPKPGAAAAAPVTVTPLRPFRS